MTEYGRNSNLVLTSGHVGEVVECPHADNGEVRMNKARVVSRCAIVIGIVAGWGSIPVLIMVGDSPLLYCLWGIAVVAGGVLLGMGVYKRHGKADR